MLLKNVFGIVFIGLIDCCGIWRKEKWRQNWVEKDKRFSSGGCPYSQSQALIDFAEGSGWNGLQNYGIDAVNPLFLSLGRGKLGRSGRLVRQADGIVHFCMSSTFRPTN